MTGKGFGMAEGFIDESFLVVAIIGVLVFSWFNFRPKGKAKCFAAGDSRSMREIAEEYNDMVIFPDKVRLNCIDPLYRAREEDEVCRRGELRG